MDADIRKEIINLNTKNENNELEPFDRVWLLTVLDGWMVDTSRKLK
jgi:hypothetical protein